jgi:membrane protease YdiL (CAAX protease family)
MTRAIIGFTAIACSLSVLIAFAAWLTDNGALLFGAMFVPALSAALIGRATGERLGIDWSRFPLRYLPLALLLIPVLMHAAMLPATSLLEGQLPWQSWLTPDQHGIYHAPAERGWGTLPGTALAARIALNALVGVVAVSFLALFEEIGWRGWLLPRLMSRMGTRSAIVVTSAIWGLWHAPFGLSRLHGAQSFSQIAEAALAWPVGVFVFGLILGWLWVRTESIWIVAIGHGSLNNWGQYAFKYMSDFTNADEGQVLLAGLSLVFAVGVILVTVGLPSARTAKSRIGGTGAT